MLTAGEIARALGGKPTGKNTFVAKCPAHEDRSPSLSLSDVDGLVLYHCHTGCSQAAVRDALVAKSLWPRAGEAGEPVRRDKPRPAARSAQPDRGDLVQRLWREGVDPRGSLAERYLNGRGLELTEDDLCGRVLRFHGRCPFGRDESDKPLFVPALLAAFRPFRNDDEARPPQAIHRIGLKPDGSKIAKLMLGAVAGSAVKLDADQDVELGLGVCEGIETGLAIRATGWRPVWALGSAGAIARFAPVPGIETLTIFADHDANGVGMAAARQCAQCWADAGCEAVIRLRAADGKDFADA